MSDLKLKEIQARLEELGLDGAPSLIPKYDIPVNCFTTRIITEPSMITKVPLGLSLTTVDPQLCDEENPVSTFTAYFLLDCELTDPTGAIDVSQLKDTLFIYAAMSLNPKGEVSEYNPEGKYYRTIWLREIVD